MKDLSKVWRRLGRCTGSTVVVTLLIAPLRLWGESCPFCYSKAMSSSAGLLQAFRNGIVILMLPPFLMSIVFTVMAYRRRNQFHSRPGAGQN